MIVCVLVVSPFLPQKLYQSQKMCSTVLVELLEYNEAGGVLS